MQRKLPAATLHAISSKKPLVEIVQNALMVYLKRAKAGDQAELKQGLFFVHQQLDSSRFSKWLIAEFDALNAMQKTSLVNISGSAAPAVEEKKSQKINTLTRKDFEKFLELAHRQNGKAAFNVAFCYERGLSVSLSLSRAIYWYEIAFKLGCVAAADKFLLLLKNAAKMGNVNAQIQLGLCHGVFTFYDRGVMDDKAVILPCIEKAAEKYPAAQYVLAKLYADGHVTNDKIFAQKKFLSLMKQAASVEYPPASACITILSAGIDPSSVKYWQAAPGVLVALAMYERDVIDELIAIQRKDVYQPKCVPNKMYYSPQALCEIQNTCKKYDGSWPHSALFMKEHKPLLNTIEDVADDEFLIRDSAIVMFKVGNCLVSEDKTQAVGAEKRTVAHLVRAMLLFPPAQKIPFYIPTKKLNNDGKNNQPFPVVFKLIR